MILNRLRQRLPVTQMDCGQKSTFVGLRRLHPDRPLVLTSPGLEPNWGPLPGEAEIFPVSGMRSARQLAAAVEAALAAHRSSGGVLEALAGRAG
jgi:hypothetical protein